MQTYKLLEAAGFVEFSISGFPIFSPIGKRILECICGLIREEVNKRGYNEISLPLVQSKKFLTETGRADKFSDEIIQLKGKFEGAILAPTNEEVYLDIVSRGLTSYRQMPIKLYQIAEKFRNIKKPKGILRSKQFLMCDMISVNPSEESLRDSAMEFESIVKAVCGNIGIFPLRAEKDNGNYVDYLVPCSEGETRISIKDGKAFYSTKEVKESVSSSSVAMYFIFNNYNDKIHYQSQDGIRTNVHIGTYGFGIQRCFHAVADLYRDNLGLNLPSKIRPFDISIIVIDPQDASQLSMSEECYDFLMRNRYKVALDDRVGRSLKGKAELSDFYGIPYKIIVGRKESSEKTLTIKDRQGKSVSFISFNFDALRNFLNDRLSLLQNN